MTLDEDSNSDRTYAVRVLDLLEGADGRVRAYYAGGYSGADWDGWPTSDPTHITRVDIASLALLSIPVGTRLMTSELVDQQIPDLGFTDLRDAPAPERDGPWAPLYACWRRLMNVDHVSRVIASKLLARKLPNLVPIWDDRVRRNLWGLTPADATRFDDWAAMHSLVADRRVVDSLKRVRAAAELPGSISLLRVLDAAVWMLDEPTGKSGAAAT